MAFHQARRPDGRFEDDVAPGTYAAIRTVPHADGAVVTTDYAVYRVLRATRANERRLLDLAYRRPGAHVHLRRRSSSAIDGSDGSAQPGLGAPRDAGARRSDRRVRARERQRTQPREPRCGDPDPWQGAARASFDPIRR
jgi:hypothetical protein